LPGVGPDEMTEVKITGEDEEGSGQGSP
jgi:hypothetical protein